MIFHRLHLGPIVRPVIWRKRNHETKQSKIIEAEIVKLKDANFLIEVHHPDWLANIVLVQKKNNK